MHMHITLKSKDYNGTLNQLGEFKLQVTELVSTSYFFIYLFFMN